MIAASGVTESDLLFWLVAIVLILVIALLLRRL